MFEDRDLSKWRVPVIILIGVVVLSGGIYVGLKTRSVPEVKQAQNKEEKKKDTDSKFSLKEDSEIWVKEVDKSNNSKKMNMVGRVPQELVGKSKDEVKSYLKKKYPERAIESMNGEEIVLVENIKTTDATKANQFCIGEKDGKVSLYKYDSEGNKSLIRSTDISVDSLPEMAQKEVKKGIQINAKSEEEAKEKLDENYGS